MKPRRYFVSRRLLRSKRFQRVLHSQARQTAWVICFTFAAAASDARGGDILRGGSTTGSRTPATTAPIGNTPPPVTPTGGSQNDTLARTTQAMQAVQAMQLQARQVAKTGANNLGVNPNRPNETLPDVPNGLGTGGLKVDTRVGTDPTLWTGAHLPTQTSADGRTQVTVQQTAQQAILNWETFNVGRDTTLKFDQSAGGANAKQWIAFNKVNDPAKNPTQILGSIQAEGQVYIINRNGIIFGGSSQANTHTLVASSLPINAKLVQNGLLNNADAEFLFDGLDKGAGDDIDPNQKFGDVVVQSGAQLSAGSSSNTGGRIMLVGPNVRNEGTIYTPDGQAILAAGLQVGIDAHATSDPSLRGLDVFIGAVIDPASSLAAYAGSATNTGWIGSPRGNITLAGREVVQQGALTATTSVALNGRIDLLAHYGATSNSAYDPANASTGRPFLNRQAGTVTTGEDSLIAILPEVDSDETTIGTELALRSQVNMAGQAVYLGENSLLYAPNAQVALNAGKWILTGGSMPVTTFVQSAGQVYLDHGATIDVAGLAAVPVSVAQNILEVQLRGAELANSPLQRLGVLRNETVFVDIRDAGIYQQDQWLGTPLADLAGFANLIQRGVAQLSTAGGNVSISAGGSFVMQSGASIDVSGGSTFFQGGMVRTSQLVTQDGRLINIRDARPDENYKGIYNGAETTFDAKWGVEEVYSNPLNTGGLHYEADSVHGAAGGSISVTAPAMALDGALRGVTVTGERQRSAPPAAASLKLSFTAQDPTYGNFPVHAPTPPSIVFQHGTASLAADAFSVDAQGRPAALRADRVEQVLLSPELLSEGGFGSLTVDNPDGDIAVAAGVTLAAKPFGSISLSASNLTIDGSIVAPGGSLKFSTSNLTLDQVNHLANVDSPSAPTATPGRGLFMLGSDAVLSTAGLWIDDRLSNPEANTTTLALTGGSIAIQSYSAHLAAGGLIDVSGGGVMNARGKVTFGNGGSLNISAGSDSRNASLLGGELQLGATLQGYSGAKAGSLSLTAPAIQVGGNVTNPDVLAIDPGFFNTGGFGSFALNGIGLAGATADTYVPGVTIAADTLIRPVAQSWIASDASADAFTHSIGLLEEGVRTPVSLSFGAIGAKFGSIILARGDVLMEAGAEIHTDAQANVSFQGETVTLLGTVDAPAGSITVTGASVFPSVNGLNQAAVTTHIGASARLSTAGKTVLITNPYGLRQGKVLAGGNITIAGNIAAEQGAVLDVSGTSGVLDLAPGFATLDPAELGSLRGRATVPVTLHSNGGNITLSGAGMLYSDATLIANAGGSSAIGGSLTVSSGRFVVSGSPFTTADINLIVSQSGAATPVLSQPSIGDEVASGLGYFSADDFLAGGFDSLTLNGNVHFEGDVAIHAPGRMRVANGGVISANGHVDLSAGHLAVGQAFRPPALPNDQIVLFTSNDGTGVTTPHTFAPQHGAGVFSLHGKLIDIGTLSLQGIGSAGFHAGEGDIRGNGTLSAAGDLTFEAGQIYPTTQSAFNVFAYDAGTEQGSVTILGGTTRALPFSAGGTLGIYASSINQGGTLRAPIGTINLGWNGTGSAPVNPIAGNTLAAPVTSVLKLTQGSTTSVSAIDPLTGKGAILPYGISLDGNSWIDPAGNNITVSGVPAKEINLSALDVENEEGSVIDIRGGGDLYAYRWVQGNGGRRDVLASSTSFAIVPGYQAEYAPYGAFNDSSLATELGGQPGYVNASLRVGDQITLAASNGLPAGTYTLLPARYALLPGAFLVTPQSGTPAVAQVMPDGSSRVAGYRANNLDPNRSGATSITNFEVASTEVLRQRAEYHDLSANTTLRNAAIVREFAVPRLPMDAGYLSFTGTTAMTLQGDVLSAASTNGRGGLIDINSPVDIFISRDGTGGAPGNLMLSAETLNNFGAESLLVGGLRSFDSDGVHVSVTTGNLTLDNAGSPLSGSDIALVAKNGLTLADGAEVRGTGNAEVDALILGNAAVAGSGDGVLVRVSGSENAAVSRVGVGTSTVPHLTLGADALLQGGSITLDSTYATHLDASASLQAAALSLGSGRISVQLGNPGAIDPANFGLVLSSQALTDIQNSTQRLSLLSYSSLDVYGTGTIGSVALEQLSLQAATIRGFHQAGGNVTFNAKSLLLGNAAGGPAPAAPVTPLDGAIVFDAETLTLGANDLRIDSFADVTLAADRGIVTSGKGSFRTAGDLTLIAPLVTGMQASNHTIASQGVLSLERAGTAAGAISGGLGAKLALEGDTLSLNSNIVLQSGELTLHATSGDLTIGDAAAARIDVGGTVRSFLDVKRYTHGGTVRMISDTGDVRVGENASVVASAHAGGGNAGQVIVSTPLGQLDLDGSLKATAGAAGKGGSFTLDTGALAGGSLGALDATLNAGGFNRLRDFRIRSGDVTLDSAAIASTYRVAVDQGDLLVTGSVDASGVTGGAIDLKAHGSLTLDAGAVLDVSAETFDAAGKGGSIVLEAGSQRNGVIDATALLDLRTGATLNLGVAEHQATSAAHGQFNGTLHLRAPRNAANTDVQVAAIGSTINGASRIVVEGNKLYDLTGSGAISTTVQNNIRNDANAFLGSTGTTTAGYTAMVNRLTALQSGLDLILAPGAEILNRTGGLTLGTTNSTATSDWNLATFRFGPRATAGVLTLRAAGDLTFYNALSDGFSGGTSLWLAPLMANNAQLPANWQSWSYHFAAGSDFSAVSFREVNEHTGNFKLGKNIGAATATGGNNATTASLIANAFQVVRTGSGDIDLHAGGNVQLLNPFASIYTAGTQVATPTSVFTANDFVLPILNPSVHPNQGSLGARQQIYNATYSMAGGNVVISAGENIERKTANNSGLIDDASRQLPNNWLYRRGYVGANGSYGSLRVSGGVTPVTDAAASTTWWVDFSNFFQSVGALGGGNVSMTAGNDVKNVDAVIPTNARAPRGIADASMILELGGGDLSVVAGNDISGGVYYVERGRGRIDAGAAITTNAAHAPSLGIVGNLNNPVATPSLAWMPTTLFAGKSQFEVSAGSDVTLGPIANPFLLPQGVNNKFWYKTYFSTYAPGSGVEVTALGGDVTLRNSVVLPSELSERPILEAWMQTQQLLPTGSAGAAFYQPWLRLAETSLDPFDPVISLVTPNLGLTSLAGDVNLAGSFTLFPSATGQLEIVSAGAVNGLQALGQSNALFPGRSVQAWNAANVRMSDANPAAVPAAHAPLNSGTNTAATQATALNDLLGLFSDSGSYTGNYGLSQTKQALHTPGLLHKDDEEPVRIYAQGGDISGLTLFTPKRTNIIASNDITDIAFYLQNLDASDVSVVSAGRDLIAYNASSPLRIAATTGNNGIAFGGSPQAGDIQISGPGALEVFAGRDIDLGIGSGNADGTGAGITSIGNLRNPYLSATGAEIILAAGIGPAANLAASQLDFTTFIEDFVKTADGALYVQEVAPGVIFDDLSEEDQARVALEVFYRILRDTGRDFNKPESAGFRSYESGMEAIKALFDEAVNWQGNVYARGRDIRTRSGGDISIFAPGGGLSLANTTIGNPLTPPGIVTEAGGNIAIFTDGSVDIGIGRIFTLRGGNAILWSTNGDIAAGSSSRTIQAAPPTRVIIDPQSASVATDLAGLATGGGIGVLATVEGVEPGDVDLIAPTGTIDAGDAGIRVTGNINLAAVQVVNAGNISAGGASTGAPSTSVSTPSVSAGNTPAGNNSTSPAAAQQAQQQEQQATAEAMPSIISAEVLGYGGDEEEEDEEKPSGL